MKAPDKPIRIFLVDDDTMFLSSLLHSLDQKFNSRIEITSFTTGEECLNKLYEEPDIVILDYYLNSKHVNAMNGIQVLKKIKYEKKDTLVIMLSSQDKLEVVSELYKNGAFEYVIKNESFFVRIENIVKNIISTIESERENSRYAKWNYIIGLSFVLLLLFDLFIYKVH